MVVERARANFVAGCRRERNQGNARVPAVPSFGRNVDRAVGGLSRLLHIRRVRHNTVGDLAPYLDAPLSVLFPDPAPEWPVERHWSRGCRGASMLEKLTWKSEHVPLSARYRARHAGEYAPNATVTARWIHPRTGPRRRAIVYVHGWLEPAPWRALFLPRLHDALEVDVLDLQLPFHGRRNPKSALFHGEFFWTADLVRSFEAMRQSCVDARTLVAFLRRRGYTEVGVIGVSMGASIAMVLACLETPPDYIVPIIGHLQLAEVIEEAAIFWRVKTDLERFGIGREQRRDIFKRFGLDQMKPRIAPARQLWVMARDDEYIRADVVEQQWIEWGRPAIEWLDGGHMTFALSLPKIVRRVRDFHESLGHGKN